MPPEPPFSAPRACRRLPCAGEAGFVTLAALATLLVIATISAVYLTSLMGEVQGEYGYHQAVSALSVAEAGVNWAGNKLQGPGAATYAGDSSQTVQGAGGQQVGIFDVVVACANGAAVSTGCTAQPTERLISATGYVPSKTLTLGRRTVQVLVSGVTPFSTGMALCGYDIVNLQPNATVYGNVGSEGTANPDMNIQSGAQVKAGGGALGSVFTVTSPDCGPCPGQVAGTVNTNLAPGTVCPNRTSVLNSFTCTPGTQNWSGGNLTINSSSASWYDLTLNKSTITFDTTGLSGPLVVQVNSISATGPNNVVQIKGGGTVNLILHGTMQFGPSTAFGQVYGSNALVNASQLVVESCSSSNNSTTPDVLFGPQGNISGVFIVPNGWVQMNPAQILQSAVLADSIQLQPMTGFTYDSTAQAVSLGTGFPRLMSWQDVP